MLRLKCTLGYIDQTESGPRYHLRVEDEITQAKLNRYGRQFTGGHFAARLKGCKVVPDDVRELVSCPCSVLVKIIRMGRAGKQKISYGDVEQPMLYRVQILEIKAAE
jgi:hypothetical protein